MSDFYADDSAREMAKWGHDRVAREMRAREAARREDLSDLLCEGYYPEDE